MTGAPAPDDVTRARLRGHTAGVSAVRFSPGGRQLASSSADATIRVWDASGGGEAPAPLQTLGGHGFGVSDVAWHPSGAYVASASDDKTLGLWDVERGKRLREMEGHTHFVFCCVFNPLGNVLVSGSLDESIRLWDVRLGRQVRAIPAHADPVLSLDVSRDGTVIASGSSDGLSRLWDLSTGLVLRTLKDAGERAPVVAACAFSPNSRYLLEGTLGDAAALRLWDWRAGPHGTVVRRLRGHACAAFCMPVAFARRGCAVAASEDGTLSVWDLASGKRAAHDVNGVVEDAAVREARDAANAKRLDLWRKLTGREKLNTRLPALQPDPRAIVAMSIHEASARVATAQLGDAEHAIAIGALPPPPA